MTNFGNSGPLALLVCSLRSRADVCRFLGSADTISILYVGSTAQQEKNPLVTPAVAKSQTMSITPTFEFT